MKIRNKVSDSSNGNLGNKSSISDCWTSPTDGVQKTSLEKTVHEKVQNKRCQSGQSSGAGARTNGTIN